MKLKHTALALLSGFAMSFACAETPAEAAVKKLIAPHLGGGASVDSVKATPYGGLFEVRTGGDILYTDSEAKFIIAGNIFETKTNRNITQERKEDINRIKFSDLPLNDAVKYVKGDGKRVLAVFEDPNCGYCKRLRKSLHELNNVTVYTFMYNILSEDSKVKSKNIWCSADRSKAWDDWMLNGKIPADAPANCDSPNDRVFELGRKLRLSGTPAIFFADGSRIPSAVDSKVLEAKLASVKVN